MTPRPIPTGKHTWLDPDWREGALAWVEGTLAGAGRRISGPVEQPHVTPWSTALRIPTDEGIVWFKATGPGTAHEGPLLEVFRRLGVRRVVLPIAIDPARSWLLFDDAGPTLRATRPDGHGDHDLGAWERILVEYGSLQRSLEGEVAIAAMLDAGTPDGRLASIPRELDRLIEDERIWGLALPDERPAAMAARQGLRDSGTLVDNAVAVMAAIGVAPSIQHDDLHGGNILVERDADRFFDWGDAVVAHPFSTLTVTFNSIVHHTGRSPDDPAIGRLRDAYLETWTDVAAREALVAAADLARDLGCAGRALAWERALVGLTQDEMDGHGDAIAGWLMEFAERLDGPMWAR